MKHWHIIVEYRDDCQSLRLFVLLLSLTHFIHPDNYYAYHMETVSIKIENTRYLMDAL